VNHSGKYFYSSRLHYSATTVTKIIKI